MNLKEYIRQVDPMRFPDVFLTKSDVKLGSVIKYITGYSRQTVYIINPIFHEAFPELKGEYVKYSYSDRLWTVDQDGNAKSMSVFKLNLLQ